MCLCCDVFLFSRHPTLYKVLHNRTAAPLHGTQVINQDIGNKSAPSFRAASHNRFQKKHALIKMNMRSKYFHSKSAISSMKRTNM